MISAGPPNCLMPASADHGPALAVGQHLAGVAGRPANSADVLVALVRIGGAAARLLDERGVTTAKLEALLDHVRPEPTFSLVNIERASQEIAHGFGADRISSLHLLLALLRTGGAAIELLRLCGQDPTKVRAMLLRALTRPGLVSERSTIREPEESSGGRSATSGDPIAESALASVSVVSNPIALSPAPKSSPALSPTHSSDDWELVVLEPPRSPVLHREREIGRLLDLLHAPIARIICVVGEPGTGRTAVLAAMAAAALEKPLNPVGALPTGASPGALLQELHRRAPLTSAVVLDGTSIVGPESSDGPAQLLATARAGRRWILTATPADLRRFELGAPDLAAALETVALAPLAPEPLVEVLEAGLDTISESADVQFSPGALRTLLRLAPRYPSERAQPGRSLSIAEIAAARALRLGQKRVGEEQITEVVADAAGVPLARLLRTDDDRFLTLETRLAERVVGHDSARARIADVLRRSYAGFRGRRPLGSLLLLGPTGVGKTETAKAIAETMFDGEAAMVRIDLSEYSEPHTVARLIGSPPGYVGYEEGGQLTEAIRRRPASVVLLDELEKAHREVLLILLQVLEDGRLTDGRGRTVDFSAAAIVMTSNLGSECYRRNRAPADGTIIALARSRLPAELWNRIDEILCYAPLKEADLARIVERIASDSSHRLDAERGISFRIDERVVEQVLRIEPDRTLGARPLRRAFERLVEGPIAAEILAGNVRRGTRLVVRCDRSGAISIA